MNRLANTSPPGSTWSSVRTSIGYTGKNAARASMSSYVTSGGMTVGYQSRTMRRYQAPSHDVSTWVISPTALRGRGSPSRFASATCWAATMAAPAITHSREAT